MNVPELQAALDALALQAGKWASGKGPSAHPNGPGYPRTKALQYSTAAVRHVQEAITQMGKIPEPSTPPKKKKAVED